MRPIHEDQLHPEVEMITFVFFLFFFACKEKDTNLLIMNHIVRWIFWRNLNVVWNTVSAGHAIKHLDRPLLENPPAKLRTKRLVSRLHSVWNRLHYNANQRFHPRLDQRRIVVPFENK